MNYSSSLYIINQSLWIHFLLTTFFPGAYKLFWITYKAKPYLLFVFDLKVQRRGYEEHRVICHLLSITNTHCRQRTVFYVTISPRPQNLLKSLDIIPLLIIRKHTIQVKEWNPSTNRHWVNICTCIVIKIRHIVWKSMYLWHTVSHFNLHMNTYFTIFSSIIATIF